MKKLVKNPLIEKRAQLMLALTLIQYLFFYTVVVLVIILLPSVMKFTTEDLSFQEQLRAGREFLFLDRRVVPVIVVVMIVESLHFLYVTHRIFGPLYRFERVLAAWRRGSWPARFQTRSKDFHNHIFEAFNEAAGAVGEDFRRTAELIELSLKALDGCGGEEPPEKSHSGLREAGEQAREALAVIEKYFPRDGEQGPGK